MRWLDGITDAMDMNLSQLWEIVEDRVAWRDAGPWGHTELYTTTEQHIQDLGPRDHSFLSLLFSEGDHEKT